MFGAGRRVPGRGKGPKKRGEATAAVTTTGTVATSLVVVKLNLAVSCAHSSKQSSFFVTPATTIMYLNISTVLIKKIYILTSLIYGDTAAVVSNTQKIHSRSFSFFFFGLLVFRSADDR